MQQRLNHKFLINIDSTPQGVLHFAIEIAGVRKLKQWDSQNYEIINEINMTPLIDVMLVLLIVFMVTLPAITNAVKIDLPHAVSAPNDVQSAHVSISIDSDGVIHWDTAIVDEADLKIKLQKAAGQKIQPEIQLYADRSAKYERVADLLSAIQQAGLYKIDFVTQPQP